MPRIHATACVEQGAEIADNVEIGPYCVIGANGVIAEGCRLVAHVHVAGHTRIGPGTVIYPFASLGTPPQSVRYRGGETRLVVGANCDIREGVTLNIGTEDGGGVTTLGDRCFLMAGSHVGHDCHVGDNVILANGAMLGGHVAVGDHTFFGGGAKVHQFVRVGESVMVAGGAGIAADVIPFGFVYGYRGHLDGLNVVGLKRRGFGAKDVRRLRGVYANLFAGPGVFADRLDAVAAEFADDPLLGRIIGFIRDGGSRPLMMPELASSNGDVMADATQ